MGNLIFFFNLHKFNQSLPIYTSVCEITTEQSIAVLNLRWIPEAK